MNAYGRWIELIPGEIGGPRILASMHKVATRNTISKVFESGDMYGPARQAKEDCGEEKRKIELQTCIRPLVGDVLISGP